MKLNLSGGVKMIEETPGYIGFYKGLHYKVGIHSKVLTGIVASG